MYADRPRSAVSVRISSRRSSGIVTVTFLVAILMTILPGLGAVRRFRKVAPGCGSPGVNLRLPGHHPRERGSPMAKRGNKKRARKKKKANHGKRPNA
ncbi:hypothetical protein GCM10010305_51370 [Streptomyces termitum]|uniref:Uncharacterized protein n=9 Tax=Streptomyces TaxID=1883 RepID=A0A918WAV7_9ACTN|nr:hypothetical protein GCM10010305_51370 [Streptomyces termitum]